MLSEEFMKHKPHPLEKESFQFILLPSNAWQVESLSPHVKANTAEDMSLLYTSCTSPTTPNPSVPSQRDDPEVLLNSQ